MSKTSLILGVGGQDGSYLADILLARGDTVHGLHRHSSVDNLTRIAHCRDRIKLHPGDVTDALALHRVIDEVGPDEVYNVADQDNVGWSRKVPSAQMAVTLRGVGNVLEAVQQCQERRTGNPIAVFQPVSCTMFGSAPPPQNEATPLAPASPYAAAKAAAHLLCRHYRRDLGVAVSCGIMFNHDSPRRAPGYLLQDVCRQALRHYRDRQGTDRRIVVGSLDTRVDVGHAREYMGAAVKMLQQDIPDDYCIGTGEAWTIRRLLAHALATVGYDNEDARQRILSEDVREDPVRLTPGAPSYRADITKARGAFGFSPSGPGTVIADILRGM